MKKWNSILFLTILLGVSVYHIISPDALISKAERRKLAGFPTITWDKLVDGSASEQVENYLLDQFPNRDQFRKAQTLAEHSIFQMTDVNGYFQIENGIYEIDSETQKQYVSFAAKGFTDIADIYFPSGNIYYAIIPDKNYFVASQNGYPSLDYDTIISTVKEAFEKNESITTSQYIDLFNDDLITINDYYRTDLHWKQESIIPVVQYLVEYMNPSEQKKPDSSLLQVTDNFEGAYLGASAYTVKPDTMYYYDDEVLQNCLVYDYEKQQYVSMYQADKLDGADAYDFYLGGARALLEIENPEQKNGRTLVLFRDSFGSSIAPLLSPYYEKIILVDLRYVTMDYCVQQIDFQKDVDVLFLYNADMLNHGNSLRF